ncbi:MAG: aminopeptidase N, partial [Bacteroidia bacterium]
MFQKIRHLFIIVTIFLSYLNSIAQKPCGYIAKVCAENGMNSVETDQAIDVTNYHIKLTIASFSNKTISGSTVVSFKVGNTNISSCQLMLEGLTVDSVVYNSNTLSFSHIDNILTSNFPSPLSAGYSAQIEVFYSGKPIRDATWGGFYFVDEYAFNLGVGFTSNPHNYGRVWFPCKDDFTDRATYQFDITTTTDKKAVCNGILLETIINTDQTLTYKWLMQDEIPTYLASFAVAPYTFTQYTHKGIPVLLSSVLSDSANMAASFENLPGCIEAYLKFYGTHTFSRIGFNAVPFNGGAMEHATNIAYPIFGITGDKAYETLYAHELAHHWWGNTVTCADATDMWINEGWASFSERLFLEWVYGTARYKEDISNNHWAVLHHAHIRDKDTLPVAGIGHDQTYGSHVYDKGADMVHTLRGYMGDEQFFKAVQSFLVDYKFKSVTTAILQTHFQNYTQVNLAPFFDQWIRKKGFVHFDVIDQQTSGNASTGFSTKLKLRQRLRFTTDLYTDVPMEITFMSADFQKQTSTHLLSNYITE